MNHVVPLAGRHPPLRAHQAAAVGERAKHRVRVGAELQLAGAERARDRERGRPAVGAVAVHAQVVVDGLSPLKAGLVPRLHQPGVVHRVQLGHLGLCRVEQREQTQKSRNFPVHCGAAMKRDCC